MQASIVEGPGRPLPGLQYIEFQAGGSGFFGASSCFIEESRLRTFCRNVCAMVNDPMAKAEIIGDNSGGLTLKVGAAHSPEHAAIEGSMVITCQLTLPTPDAHNYQWGMQFGFWFEREQLYQARKVEWVKHYAG